MAFKFVVLCAAFAVAQAGIIATPAVATYASHPEHSSYTNTVSYSAPKAYIAHQPASVATYHYPEHHEHHYAPALAYHHEPTHAVIATPHHYEHGQSEQNIVRSAHGTVSQTSKVVHTPTSSVHKSDTRVVNDGYKTVSYEAPTHYVSQQAPTHYVAQQAHQYVHSAPAHQYVHSAPAHQYVHSAPAVLSKTVVSQPAVYSHASPVTHYSHAEPQVAHYAQSSPVLTKVHYSPAVEVSHASYESPIAHYAW